MSALSSKALQVISILATLGAASAFTQGAIVQSKTDTILKNRIDFGIETNTLIRRYDIDVTVVNGDVTLKGDVATEAQKAEATRLSKAAGANKIDNAITVDPGEDEAVAVRLKSNFNKAGEPITDVWITSKVRWFFVADDTLKGSSIYVGSRDHVVTLKGMARTNAARTRAVSLAMDTEGVRRVVDELTIGR